MSSRAKKAERLMAAMFFRNLYFSQNRMGWSLRRLSVKNDVDGRVILSLEKSVKVLIELSVYVAESSQNDKFRFKCKQHIILENLNLKKRKGAHKGKQSGKKDTYKVKCYKCVMVILLVNAISQRRYSFTVNLYLIALLAAM